MTACRSACPGTSPVHQHGHWLTATHLVFADRWIGPFIAMYGAYLVAPHAPRQLTREYAGRLTRLLARLLPRAEGQAHSITLDSSAGVSDVNVPPQLTIADDRAASEAVRAADTQRMLQQLTGLQRYEFDLLQKQLTSHSATLQQTSQRVTELEARGEEAKRAAERVDARGFLPTVMGIVLTAAPDDLLSFGRHSLPALMLPVCGVVFTVAAGYLAHVDRVARRRDGVTAPLATR